MTTPEQKQTLLQFIDRGSWKHSWHLEYDTYGAVNFSSKKNLKKFRDLIFEAHEEARSLRIQACEASRILNSLIVEYALPIDEEE